MFCGKCGAEIKDGAEFCTNCGAKLGRAKSANLHSAVNHDQNEQNRKVGIIAVAAIIVLVILVGIFLFGGRSYKTTVKKFIDAEFDANAKAIVALMPDKMVDYALEEDGYDSDDLDDFINDLEDQLQDQLDSLDSYLGEGWKISYEIVDAKEIKGNELDDIKDAYEDADVKVSACKSVEVELTITADDTENTSTLDLDLIKVGRSWYLDMMSMGSLF